MIRVRFFLSAFRLSASSSDALRSASMRARSASTAAIRSTRLLRFCGHGHLRSIPAGFCSAILPFSAFSFGFSRFGDFFAASIRSCLFPARSSVP